MANNLRCDFTIYRSTSCEDSTLIARDPAQGDGQTGRTVQAANGAAEAEASGDRASDAA